MGEFKVIVELSTSLIRPTVSSTSFFVIFNLYCPNETNDTRLPYKLNFLHHLEARITRLLSLGRNVIVLGDINVCHRPLDNGEGGIQRNAEEHFDHPARKWFDRWVSPNGEMHDVTREAWPERKGMFTCKSSGMMLDVETCRTSGLSQVLV